MLTTGEPSGGTLRLSIHRCCRCLCVQVQSMGLRTTAVLTVMDCWELQRLHGATFCDTGCGGRPLTLLAHIRKLKGMNTHSNECI